MFDRILNTPLIIAMAKLSKKIKFQAALEVWERSVLFFIRTKKFDLRLSVFIFIFELVSKCCNFVLNPFSTNLPLLYPPKTSGFLMFLGGIEVENWLTMGWWKPALFVSFAAYGIYLKWLLYNLIYLAFPSQHANFQITIIIMVLVKKKSIYRTETLVNSHFYIRYSEANTRGVL